MMQLPGFNPNGKPWHYIIKSESQSNFTLVASVTVTVCNNIHVDHFWSMKNLHKFHKRSRTSRHLKTDLLWFHRRFRLLSKCFHQMEIKIAILYIFILMRDNFSRPRYSSAALLLLKAL